MKIVDIILYVSIALMYNIIVHNIASVAYKDQQYEEKHTNTIIMLILFGGIGIIISKLLTTKFPSYDNVYLNYGLYYGGILLILTAVFSNWNKITEEMKFIVLGLLFGVLIWFGYKKDSKEKKEKATKINEKVISELVNIDKQTKQSKSIVKSD